MITVPLQIDGKNGPDLLAAGKGTRVVRSESPPNARDLAHRRMHTIRDQGGWTMGPVAVDMDAFTIDERGLQVVWYENLAK